MKRALVFGFVIGCVVFFFSLAVVIAQDDARTESVSRDRTVLARQVPSLPARTGEEAAAPSTAGAGGQSASSDQFPVATLIIGLGLAAVIVLVIFKWGAGAQPKKQEEK